MNNKDQFTYYLFSSLLAGVVVSLITGITFSIILFIRYNRNFQELAFFNLLIYLIGKIGFITIIFSFVFSILIFIFQKLFRKFLKITNQFSFFLAAVIFIHFCFWVGFYVNSNILRFSREFKSYAVDFLIILFGLLLFIFIHKVIPPIESIGRQKSYKFLIVFLSVFLVISSLIRNPFALNLYLTNENLMLTRNYDSKGNYLISSKDISTEDYNIILFSIDTLRSDGLSCYGYTSSTSPNIDLLATEGILFKNALAQSSWTLPSHMTMFTSLYPSVHGCTTSTMWTRTIERLNEHWITLPEVLKSFGFSTAAFTDGKLLGPVSNFDQGFDICDDSGGHIEKIAQKAIQWLKNYHSDKPFFLFLHCYDLHKYNPPEDIERIFVEEYEGKLLKFRKSGSSLEERAISNAFYSLSDKDIKYLRNLYDATIYSTDREFGKVLSYLKKNNLYENTIIIVTSDHGEEFWEHGGTGHGWSLHQHQLKVPLIIKSPTFSRTGRKIDVWVGIIDIAPTILDILGIPIPNEFQGISLTQLIEKNKYNERNLIAEASHLGNQKCLIKKGYSFLFNQFAPLGEDIFNWKRFLYVWRKIMQFSANELYNLRNDPSETVNVISGERALADDMKGSLLEEIKNKLKMGAKFSSIERIDMDEKTKEHLRSLGYIK